MAHDVSPYLLAPRRDLATACRDVRKARGLPATLCGACGASEFCQCRVAHEAREAARKPARTQLGPAGGEDAPERMAKRKLAG